MSSRTLVRVLCAVICAIAFTSCSEPVSYESFVRADQTGDDGRYHFCLDMSDTLCSYALSFYTALDGKPLQESIPISVNWTSDKGESFGELVYWIPSGEVMPYRKDIRPAGPCVWDLAVSVQDVPGMRGLGMIMEKKK